MSAEAFADKKNIVFIESTTLQIRKILELIAYLSMLVNTDKLNSKQRSEWHAKEIIENLSEKTTVFYPFPSNVVLPDSSNSQPILFPIGYADALSQTEFKELYQFCGKVLHAQHPFKKLSDIKVVFEKNKNSIEKLKRLLASHTIGIKHETSMYTFLFVEIDFTSNQDAKPSSIRQFNSRIFNEKELIAIFNGNY
ncbi:hypothetical protein [Pseudoalteromonas sp. PB2-1]|uniref:hypothetical protein n=1 Tax=Pseudoalteromonas sp. PB2-1 TaxID=2907242 RepID=UPI00386BDA88